MGSILNGNKHSLKCSRVPTELLASAVRYEAARAAIFERQGKHLSAKDAMELMHYYYDRCKQEGVKLFLDPGPT